MRDKKIRIAGYTLVEVLVVVAILAMLAGVSYPIAIRMIANGDETEARAVMKDLNSGLDMYLEDNYGIVPRAESVANEIADQDWICSIGPQNKRHGGPIVRTLTGEKLDNELKYNMRNKVYFSAKPAKEGKRWLIYEDGYPAGLVDPWGRGYVLFLDMTGDDVVDTQDMNVSSASLIYEKRPQVDGTSFVASRGRGSVLWEYELYSVEF